MLTEAAEIEHNLLCSYLYAGFSLRAQNDPLLNEHEADAVDRWRRLIMGVAIEEMGHLALVNNLIVALGGSPHFDRPNFPVPPGYHPASFIIRLTPFNRATLDHFIYLERPEDVALHDDASFKAITRKERRAPETRITPAAFDYSTIGEFYNAIRERLTSFSYEKGRDTFLGTELGQLGPEMVDLPGLVIIEDLAAALMALDTIIEQGEGSSTACEDCHFTRFTSIKSEWDELDRKNPRFSPAYPAAVNPVMRRPLATHDRIWITAPRSAALLDLANALYAETLVLLTQIYDPLCPHDQAAVFADAAIKLMHAVGRIGTELASLPAHSDEADVNAGMTFAVPRNLGIRSSLSRIATTAERLKELTSATYKLEAHEAGKSVASACHAFKELCS